MAGNGIDYSKPTRDPKFWRSHFVAWRRSGLSQAEYCRQNKLRAHQFGYWKKVLKDGDAKSSTPAFVPVPIPRAPDKVQLEDGYSGLTIILKNGIRVELAPTFNATTLIKVVTRLGVVS